MKKIFTFIAAAFMAAGGVNAQTYDFSGLTADDFTIEANGEMTTYTMDGVEGLPSVNYTSTSKEDMVVIVRGLKFQYQNSSAKNNAIKTGTSFLQADSKSFYIILENVAVGSKITLYVSAKGSTNASFSALTGCMADDADAASSVARKDDVADYVALTFTATAATVTIGETAAGYRISKAVVEEGNGDQGGDVTPSEAKIWNFSEGLSDTDEANLKADETNWEYKSDGYWANKISLAEKNVYTALNANGVELEFTKGLEFARDNSAGISAGSIRLYADRFAFNGGKNSMKIPALHKGDVIKMRIKGGGDSDRTIAVTNADKSSIDNYTEDGKAVAFDVELNVSLDGDVVLTPDNGFHFYYIAVNTELSTGINSVQAGTVANGAVYNLAGQKVDASYKGIVIKDGKKLVQK